MIAKIAVVLAVIAIAHAGEEAPPPKAVTYNVPTHGKVTLPGPTVTRHVETYSAPSIEKTTTITRTITAPINAPAAKYVSYAAPSAPVAVAAAAPVATYGAPAYAAPAVAAPVQYAAPVAYAAPAYAAPVKYAAPAYAAPAYAAPAYAAPAYAAPAYAAVKAYSEPTLTLGSPSLGFDNSLGHYAQGLGLSTTYSAPSLGYTLGAGGYAAAGAYHVKGGY